MSPKEMKDAHEAASSEQDVASNTDVIPGPPGFWARVRFSLSRWASYRPSSKLFRWVAAIIFVSVTVGSVGVAYATYDYSDHYSGLILPGTSVEGVELGGMTQAEALRLATSAVEPDMERTVTLRWRDKTWEVTPRRLGARNDVAEAVAAAAEASRDASFLDKARLRVFGPEDFFNRPVAISYPKRALRTFLEGLASGFDRPARDATVDYSSGWVKVVEEHSGRELKTKQTHRRLARALDGGATSVKIVAKVERPKVRAGHFDEVLLLRIGENKLYLYEDGEITHRWTVATGQPEYPTPTGIYEITEKRYLPTWVNPDPTGWGASMPLSIPPGPGNPLGLRALNWSAEAIRFHGTSATYSLGYNASHGCVRLSNEEVIKLYDMIDVGTPIVSTVVAPLRPMYASAPDPTVVQPESGNSSSSTDRSEDSERKPKAKKGN